MIDQKSDGDEQIVRPYHRNGFERSFNEAIKSFDFTESESWKELADLSEATTLDGIEVFENTAVSDGSVFYAAATVYVTLVYGKKTDEIVFKEAFPARVYFVDEGTSVVVTAIKVDTRSFYE